MRQSILIFFIIFYFLKLQANDSLKGGAGIKQNGQVKTFYSAQIHILPESELLQNIPQLESLIEQIITSDFITYDLIISYVQNLRPSKSRQYFRVDPQFFNETIQQRIKE